jgi:hypothetical protein
MKPIFLAVPINIADKITASMHNIYFCPLYSPSFFLKQKECQSFLLQAASISALALQCRSIFLLFNIPTTPVLATPVCTLVPKSADDGYLSAVLNSVAQFCLWWKSFSIQLLLILIRFDIDFRFKTVFCAVGAKKKLKNKAAYQDFFHYVLVGFM